MRIAININSTSAPPPPPPEEVYHLPSDSEFYRLLWDDESGQVLRPNLPATVESVEGLFIPMPSGYQHHLFEVVWNYFAPWQMELDLRKKRWAGFFDSHLCFTNHGNGSDVRADYVNGTNLDKPAMARQMITTEGNVLRKLGEKKVHGELCIICEALTVDERPDLQAYLSRPWILHYCTTMRTTVIGEHHAVGRFPQLSLSELDVYRDVPLPLLSRDGTMTFRAKYLQKLEQGSPLPNPYWPPAAYNPSYFERS